MARFFTQLALLDPSVPVRCPCQYPHGCVCDGPERVLRAYCYKVAMPPMTPAHREECLAWIENVEGYTRAEYQEASDQDLARGVLHSMVDYARDKGLL